MSASEMAGCLFGMLLGTLILIGVHRMLDEGPTCPHGQTMQYSHSVVIQNVVTPIYLCR